MAISVSVLTTPTALEPINAPLWFRTNSTSSGLTDFKYVFRPEYKIEPFASTSFTTLGTYRIPPKPTSGDGLFSPHRALKSFLNADITPFITGFTASTRTLIDYRIKYGFEYNPNKFFTDTISVGGNMGLTFSTTHEFEVGDIITINKDNKNYNPQYDGTCSVASVPNAYSIKTDKVFSSTILAGESGYVTDQFRISGTSSEFYTFNGTRQYDERTKDYTTYLMGTASNSNNKFLTNCYNTSAAYAKPIKLDDYETLSLCLKTNQSPMYLYVNTYDVSDVVIGTYSTTLSSGSYRRLEIGVGPANLSGLGVSFTSVYRYVVYIKSAFGLVSELRHYKIDTQCSNYEKQRIVFLNRMGGYDYFSFTLDSKRSISISKTEYEKILSYNYSIGDRGKTVLSQKAEERMVINSNWITENDAIWLEELLTSPDAYVLTTNMTKLPIIITDNSYEVKTYLRNQVFNLVLNYKFAYDINLQNE